MKAVLLLSFVAASNAFCCAPAFTTCCMAYQPPTIIGYQRIPIYAKVPRRPVPVPETYDIEEVIPTTAVRAEPVITEEIVQEPVLRTVVLPPKAQPIVATPLQAPLPQATVHVLPTHYSTAVAAPTFQTPIQAPPPPPPMPSYVQPQQQSAVASKNFVMEAPVAKRLRL
ncbi:hypothetical protein Q1695_002545 [Nippostrongylus brasiliensis]|nr:hypothetical protein Q1695_002545 [Nippostrongylus brasiliensis]